MLTRFDPFRDFERVFERPWGPTRQPTMPLDAYRHGDTYVINVDLPGFDPATIDVSAEKDVLSVRAERHWEPVEGDEVVAAERTHGQFFRQMFLGEGLDTDNIHATYDNGVLLITIPLLERAKPRRIEVTQSDARQHAIEAESSSGT
jgi:HSP20 family protein